MPPPFSPLCQKSVKSLFDFVFLSSLSSEFLTPYLRENERRRRWRCDALFCVARRRRSWKSFLFKDNASSCTFLTIVKGYFVFFKKNKTFWCFFGWRKNGGSRKGRTNVSITEEIKGEKRGRRRILRRFHYWLWLADVSKKKEERERKGKTNRQAIDTGLDNFVCLFLNR